jgi:lipid A 3-O-deacylase
MGFRTENYWGLDIVPHGRVALGNVYIFGEVGTLFRAGYNLPSEYVISPLESFSTHPSYDPPKWSFYGFAGADGRIIGRNLFLDGNSFHDSHSVEKEILVADLRAGGAVRYRGFEVVGSVVHRTREFELQHKDENFISITFQFHF